MIDTLKAGPQKTVDEEASWAEALVGLTPQGQELCKVGTVLGSQDCCAEPLSSMKQSPAATPYMKQGMYLSTRTPQGPPAQQKCLAVL